MPGETRAEQFAACPLCAQYSHSISDDQVAAAFNHFQSMFSHRGDGIPTQNCFDEQTRDAAQVLMAAARPTPTAPDDGELVERDCPHAAPFRYCETCKVEPCPIGLGENVGLSLIDKIAIKLGYHRMIGSPYGVTARAVLEACHHAELVEAATLAFDCLLVGDPEREHARTAEALRKLKKVLAKIGGEHVSHNRR